MDVDYKQIEDYFALLAKNHVYINHSDTEKHFYRIDVEEYLTKIDSVKYPFLSLERAEFNLSAPNNDNISQNRTISFMVVNKFSLGDYNRVNEIYTETEQVAEDIINRIISDVENLEHKALLRDLQPGTIALQHLPMHPVELYCGVRVTLTLQSRYEKQVDNTKWKDLN